MIVLLHVYLCYNLSVSSVMYRLVSSQLSFPFSDYYLLFNFALIHSAVSTLFHSDGDGVQSVKYNVQIATLFGTRSQRSHNFWTKFSDDSPRDHEDPTTIDPNSNNIPECLNLDTDCNAWASLGYCFNSEYADFLRNNCPLACGICVQQASDNVCEDVDANCLYWKNMGDCRNNFRFMFRSCRRSCGFCSHVFSADSSQADESVSSSQSCTVVQNPIPQEIRLRFQLTLHHQKFTEAYGIPIVGSLLVSDAALQRACYLTRFLLADRPELRRSFIGQRGHVAVVAQSENTTDIPEYQYLLDRKTAAEWNKRARAFGADTEVPMNLFAEENLLCYPYPKDQWFDIDVSLHESAHGLHLLGAALQIDSFNDRLRNLYEAAMHRGHLQNSYAATNEREYFAEGVTSFFNQNRCASVGINGHRLTSVSIDDHQLTCNSDRLQKYDPDLFSLIQELFPCGNSYVGRCEDQPLAAKQRLKQQTSNGQCVDIS